MTAEELPTLLDKDGNPVTYDPAELEPVYPTIVRQGDHTYERQPDGSWKPLPVRYRVT